MPQKIIIIRHGETEWNVERRLQGWSNIPLNINGRGQAAKVALRLKDETPIAIYSSDHKRAHTTANHIAKIHGLSPHKRMALREDRMGIFEGWQWEKEPDAYKQELWQERIRTHAIGDIDWKVEGGESLREHTSRVHKLIKQIEAKHNSGTVVLVTHGGTINRVMEIYGFKKITDEYIRFGNTSMTVIVKNKYNKYILDILNDTSHL